MGILKRMWDQFTSHPFKKYKGIKLAQTSAATITSDSKSLITNTLKLKRSETQLRKQIQDYKEKVNEFRGMRGPGPGTEKHGRAKDYEREYQNRRAYIISLIASISNTINALAKHFDETVETLRNITLDSQVILFELEENLNKFAELFSRKYKRLKSRRIGPLAERLAEGIDSVKEYLKKELRVLWQSSKAQKRRIPSKYTIEEISFMGNVPILRKIKRYAIESGKLIMIISDISPTSKFSIEGNSRKLIEDIVIIQKDAKVLFNRIYHLLKRTKNDMAIFDEVNKRRFLGVLNKSQGKYDSIMRDITTQSLRLYLDIRVRPISTKAERPKRILRLPRRVKRRAA